MTTGGLSDIAPIDSDDVFDPGPHSVFTLIGA